MTSGDFANLATGFGHGKTILIGEHHVMDGALALAVGLAAFRTEVTLEKVQEGPLEIVISSDVDPHVADDTRRMLVKAAQAAELTGTLRAEIQSSVPMRRGLGSSAALAVAAVRAAWHLAGRGEPDYAELLAAARACESIVHGESSGLDPAAASGTDPVLFQRGQVLQRVTVSPKLVDARWLLVDLGVSVPTRDAIAIAFAMRRELGAAQVHHLNDLTTSAANQAKDALESGDLTRLSIALRTAGDAMTPLGVVNDQMEHALQHMRDAGALATKQTGAGMGGMLLALCADAAMAQHVAVAVHSQIAAHWIIPVFAENS